MEIQIHEISAIKYMLSSYIFISFNETKIGLLSSLYLEEVIILTSFLWIKYIDLSLVE